MNADTKGLFKVAPKDKAQNTHDAARAIISAESQARVAKTARLKEQRMARAAAEPDPVAAPKKTKARKSG